MFCSNISICLARFMFRTVGICFSRDHCALCSKCNALFVRVVVRPRDRYATVFEFFYENPEIIHRYNPGVRRRFHGSFNRRSLNGFRCEQRPYVTIVSVTSSDDRNVQRADYDGYEPRNADIKRANRLSCGGRVVTSSSVANRVVDLFSFRTRTGGGGVAERTFWEKSMRPQFQCGAQMS